METWNTRRQADEVEVFGMFGGDLPVIACNRKPYPKTTGLPLGQRGGGVPIIDASGIGGRMCSLLRSYWLELYDLL